MNFMFLWQEQYLTRSLSEWVRYCSCHLNIKFISSRHRVISSVYVWFFSLNLELMYRSIPKPPIRPPGKPRGIWLSWKNFSQIPRYVAYLDGQMPHLFELQRGSNSPPSRHVKATVETSSAKFSATMNSLFSLSSLHTSNKGIFHDITI